MAVQIVIEAGAPISCGPLTLFPLRSQGAVAPPYLAGPQAAHDTVVVSELDGPQVGTLQATNSGAQPVLLLGGEFVVGAQQDRTLNVSVLLPAAANIDLPVSCVEAGRWNGGRTFGRTGRIAPPALRSDTNAGVQRSVREHDGRASDQGQVWDRVASYVTSVEAEAPTGSYTDAHEHVAGRAGSLVVGLRPEPGQTGVAAAVFGRIVAVDLFDRPETLEAYWDGLLSGYATDAVVAAEPLAPLVPTPADVEALLARVLADDAVKVPAVGLGEEIHFETGEARGTALVWEDALVHLSAVGV